MWIKLSRLKNKDHYRPKNAPLPRCVLRLGVHIVICAGIIWSSLAHALPARAIGITPALIEVNDLLPSSEVEDVIYVSRANPKTTNSISITLTGSGAEAIQIEHPNQFELPQGVQNTPLPFIISPQGFLPGTYEVFLTVQLTASDESANGSSVLTGSQARIVFSVTTEATQSITIEQVAIQDAVADVPLNLTFQAANAGNTETSFKFLHLTITDNSSDQTWEETLDANNLGTLPPFSVQQLVLPTQVKLPKGSYTASVSLDELAGSQISSSPFTFTVASAQATGLTPEGKGGLMQKSSYWVIGGIVGMLISVFLGVCLMRSRPKQ